MADTSPEALRELLRYDPETGSLIWRHRGAKWFKGKRDMAAWNARYADQEAFTSKHKVHKQGSIFNKRYLAHRVAWAIHYGDWPPKGMEVDHRNGDGGDNRIANLRLATPSENMRNRPANATNACGLKGVDFIPSRNRWRAKITLHGKTQEIGQFKTKEEAHLAYTARAKVLHGEFARAK
jgi:hypothetical protein